MTGPAPAVELLSNVSLKSMENYTVKVKPRRFVYHVSFRHNRKSILKMGLIGKTQKTIGYQKAIFAHNHFKIGPLWYPFVLDHWDMMFNPSSFEFLNDDNPMARDFDSLNYDVWRIDTEAIKNEWFIDNVAAQDFMSGCRYPYYIMTKDGWIPPTALKLVNYFRPYKIRYRKGEVAHIVHEFK